jgi:hypothetical protein
MGQNVTAPNVYRVLGGRRREDPIQPARRHRRLYTIMTTNNAAAAVLVALALAGSPLHAQPAAPIFTYHSGFWLNLHHFLYVLGRAEAKFPDSGRRAVAGAPDDEAQGLAGATAEERRVWCEVVAAYAKGPSRRDPVFDQGLIAAGRALARAGDAGSLEGAGVAAALSALLERAAPIYRRHWWAAHARANQARWRELEPQVREHGAAILAFITRVYKEAWPAEGYPLQFAAWVNWAGAFSTRDRHLMVASPDERTRGQSILDEAWKPYLAGAGSDGRRQIDAGFEQVGRVRMAQRVDMRAFGNPAAPHCAPKGALETAARDGPAGVREAVREAVSRGRREQPRRGAVGPPRGPEHRQQGGGQGYEAVLLALPMKSVKIIPNQQGSPQGKLADAEVIFEADAGPLSGLKLIGFAVWERRDGGRNVTFPARQYSVNGERRSFALLRPANGDLSAQDLLRRSILDAYTRVEAEA